MSKYVGVTPVDPTSSNPTWQYRIKIKNADGKLVDTRIRKDANGMPFLKARDAYEAKMAHEQRIRTMTTETPSEPSVTLLSDVYANYLSTAAKTKAAATLRKQDSMWRNYVSDAFGSKDINSITKLELETFLADIYSRRSYKYTEGFLKFFYLLFSHAYKMEKLDAERYLRNFVTKGTRLEMPPMQQIDKEEEEEVTSYTQYEIELMEEVLKGSNLLVAFRLGLYAGLRISETFALRWKDIDFNKCIITINRQLHYIDGVYRLCGVKTLKSVRKVYITEDFAEWLWMQYSAECQYREELKEGYRDTERIYDEVEKRWLTDTERDFVNRKTNGELLTTNSMKYWVKQINPVLRSYAERKHKVAIMSNCGIIPKFEYKQFKYHALRHTFATRAAAANMPFYMLMEMMGHLKIDTTKKYYINTQDETMIERTKDILNVICTKEALY